MSLVQRLNEDLKKAMKSGDKAKVETLRMLKSQLHNVEISKGSNLDEADEIAVLNSAVKKHKEAMEMYEKGERMDLYEKEKRELMIIQSYLPEPLSRDELENSIDAIIQKLGATSSRDFGRVMKEAIAQFRGRAEGKLIQEIVRTKLA
ncbi:GatB/YqeY domain-containing protein [candidate division KSB1 bacterium]|nr:MAG: GatB/YqeY domain-containing protein [candidate division KSB1 bacterium]RKY89299.1 MAG: GatB/YqeY domain-containing protein [candidate division KSB1 bacterium]